MKRVIQLFPATAILVLTLSFAVFAQPAAPVPKDVEVYAQRIHYLEAGSGPPVILLHGLGGDATHWSMTIPALASKYHVFVPDQIGFGQSNKPLINYRVATLVNSWTHFTESSESKRPRWWAIPWAAGRLQLSPSLTRTKWIN